MSMQRTPTGAAVSEQPTVLLIEPPGLFLEGHGHTRQVLPLGLASVGASVADVARVRLLLPDTRAYTGPEPWDEILAAVAEEAPAVVGLTAVTATFPAASHLAALIKERWPTLPIVLGGVHASTLPRESLAAAPAIDWLISGEGEGAFGELLAALQANDGRRASPEQIAGLHWRDEQGDHHAAPPRPPQADLDALPTPLHDGLVWPQDIQPAFHQAVITLRGCPYRCIYCAVPGLDASRTRYRSATRIVDEIADLRARFDIDYLLFHDSVFTLHRKRTLALCREMIDRGQQIPFCCQTRADRLDPALLQAMVQAGLHQVFFGIESGDPETLRRIRKDMPLSQIRDAVAMVKAAGVRCSGFFMIGWPWEDEATMERTADFACDLGLDAVSLFSATPLPGTELWRLAANATLPESIDFRRPQVNLTTLTDEDFTRVYDRIAGRIDTHNIDRMMQGGADGRLNWISP